MAINYDSLASSTLDPSAFLPANPNFSQLAAYEGLLRKQYAKKLKDRLSQRRGELATSLTEQGRRLFETANPYILEDLQSRGLATSPTAVAQSQAEALRDIELQNQRYLQQFEDTALGAELQAEQDILETPIELRRAQLEAGLQESLAGREEALARSLARQQSKNALTQSLIGLGGNLGSSYLTARMFGGGRVNPITTEIGDAVSRYGPRKEFLPGGGTSGTPLSRLFGSGGSLLNTAGTSSPFSLGNIGAAGLGYQLGKGTFGESSATNVGAVLGAGAGSFFGPVGAGIGAYLGQGAGRLAERSVKGIEKSLGGTAGSAARYFNPFTGIPAAAKKFEKSFGLGKSGESSFQSAHVDLSKKSPQEIATNLGKTGWFVGYDANEPGSFERNYNQVLSSLEPADLVTRYETASASQLNTPLDQKLKRLYDQGKAQVGRALTPDEFAYIQQFA